MKMINNTTIVNRMATAGEYLAPGDIILQIPAVTSGKWERERGFNPFQATDWSVVSFLVLSLV